MSDGQSESIEAANLPDRWVDRVRVGWYLSELFLRCPVCGRSNVGAMFTQEFTLFACGSKIAIQTPGESLGAVLRSCRPGSIAIATPGGMGSPELRERFCDLGEGPPVGQTSKPEKERNG